MREYLLKVIGAVILYSLGESFLPEGNIKKYSSVVLALLVTLSFLSPFEISTDFKDEIFQTVNTEGEDTFSSEVRGEYEKRIENMILENTGEMAEVETDEDFKITSVYTTESAKEYIINNLGVDKNAVKTR
ncbi:MAG: hypothetical protein IJT38_00190 [Clostridia bacterium]|nr:hypothetical protein [Clostridia bacterium]